MKKFLMMLCLLGLTLPAGAQSYPSLDPGNPIQFHGDHIVYQGRTIVLGPKALFIDGRLPDEMAARYPYAFRSFAEAIEHLTDGTEAEPMVLYLAPWVYWVDDPDDPEIRKPKSGRGSPFGMEIECEWLRFEGLTDNARNVVLASNRGQTHGAEGNFTMFNFSGDGLSAENVTFGNYCNIDLVFPLDPALNRAKRADAIVQAQLIYTNADRAWARNCRFVSRLNLNPFRGGKRVLFDRCYFECTDDSLCGTGVYIGCTLGFYAPMPFGSTQGTGAVFLDCDMEIRHRSEVQYINKVANQVALVDNRFHGPDESIYLGWARAPRQSLRCYQYQVTMNGEPVLMEKNAPWLTVDMTGKPVLDAYRIEYNGEVIYNTYNLLRGDDDWDPMGIKEKVRAAEKAHGKRYTNIPTYLRVDPASGALESGVTTANLTTTELRFANYPAHAESVAWSVPLQSNGLVAFRPEAEGTRCEVIGTNENDETKTVMVVASTPSGLESASILTVAPTFLDPPALTRKPEIRFSSDGRLHLEYQLDLGDRPDQSEITWLRSPYPDGREAIEVAVTRLGRPQTTYTLTPGDAGHYLIASIRPKHLRSHPGEAQTAVTSRKINSEEVAAHRIDTSFEAFPTLRQPLILPGSWSVDTFKPEDLSYYTWKPDSSIDPWFYGEGQNGALNRRGLIQATRGARLLYTPVEGKYGDMEIRLDAAPYKDAGQGFGSATGQYLDLFIKYDSRTQTGYGLRIVRTPKHDRAVDFILMKYENGVSTELTAPVASSAYRTTCSIRLRTEGNRLIAHVETTAPDRSSEDPEVVPVVDLEAEITPNAYGGMGVLHTGSVGGNCTLLEHLIVDWK